MDPQYQQYPQQYPEQPQYPQNQPPRRTFDTWTIAVIVIAVFAVLACLGAAGILCIFVVLAPPPSPATPLPAASVPTNAAPATVAVVKPTLDPASVGKIINPYTSANLAGMSVLQIDILDSSTGNYVRKAQLTGSDLDIFNESFNISVQTVAPDTSCPDHVRLSATRADGTVVTMGACLKQVVILRGIPDLGGADAPMGPRFSDALRPYLPDAYLQLLNF